MSRPRAAPTARKPVPTARRAARVVALTVLAVTVGAVPALPQEPAGGEQAAAADTSARRDTLEDAPAGVRALEPLTVTVTRTEASPLRLPFAVQALEADAFRAGERGIGLEEALRAVPGVVVHDRRNFSLGDRIAVRGAGARAQFGVRGVRVLLDGIPLTMPDGQSALTNLDPHSVGRAEIVRGPAAALYGNAAGGVLSFHTREPGPASVAGGPRLLAGSHGLWELRGEAGGRTGETSWTVTGARLSVDGFREHSSADVWRTNAVVRARPASGASLTGVFHLYHTPFAENPSSLALEDAAERPRTARPVVVAQGLGESTTQAQAGVAGELPVAPRLRVRGAAWGVFRDLWNPIPDRVIDLERRAGGLRLEAAGGGGPGAGLRWTAGVEVERQRDLRRESENLGVPEGGGTQGDDRAREGDPVLDQRETVLGLGPFAQAELGLATRWALTLAARWDRYRFVADDRLLADGDDGGSRVMSRLSPAAGLVFVASPRISTYANVATAFQTPTTSELSNRPDGSGGFDPSLDPERTVSVELGARGTLGDRRLGFDLALWRARVSDALVPFEGATGETFFRNAGRSDRTGLEASLAWQPAAGVEARLAYAWQRFRFAEFATEEGDFAGSAEPGVPEHYVYLGWLLRGPGPLRSELDLRWADAFPVDDANAARNPSWRTVDLRLSLDPEEEAWARPFLGVNNLFGERYNGSVVPNAFGGRYYEPSPGFELYAGLSLSLGGRARAR